MPIYKTPKGLLYFAHVPRAGGSSVENHLRALFGAPAFLDRGHRSRVAPWTATSPQHVTVEDLARLFPSGFFDHAFALVRHPLDRLVSVFRYQKHIEGTIAEDMTFDDWLASAGDAARDDDNHALPQSAFVPKRARIFRIEDGMRRVERYLQNRLGGAAGKGAIRRLNRGPGGGAPIAISEASRAILLDRYAEDFERFGYRLEDARVLRAEGTPARAGIAVAIRVATPSPEKGDVWGEHAFAEGLADALQRQGARARIDYVGQWRRGAADEIDLVIRGHGYRKRVYLPKPDHAAVMWNIYPAWPEFQPGELAAFDHLWVASATAARDFGAPAELLPQCFDARRMAPVERPERAALVLVANNYERGKMRRIAEWALDAGLTLRIWGKGWAGTPAEPHVVAGHLPNERLAEVYGNALAVLNDHANDMSAAGFPSNRLFDALACAAPVISDPVAWLPEDLTEHVVQVGDAASLGVAVEWIAETYDAERPRRLALAKRMRDAHSFDARARRILDRLLALPTKHLEAAE